MLMSSEPKSPSPEYDFMLKENKPARRSLPLPKLPNPILYGLSAVVVIFLIIIISSVISGRNKGSSLPYAGVLARGQETLRVTKLAKEQLGLQDPQTQALAATVNSSLSSDQQQLKSYLTKNKIKITTLQLAADTDKRTDTTLQTASQNNNLDSAYVSYLKNALVKYQTDLQNALSGTGPNGKVIISNGIESTRALLNSSPLKS
jgi:hypothetical protein